jgi:cell division protein DivIC
MAKKLKKKTRYRILICGIISLACLVYFVFSLIYYSVNVVKLQKEKDNLTTSLKELQNKEKELSSEIVKLKDPDYVARYARENYLYSKDGEYIIKIDRSKEENTNTSDNSKKKDITSELILLGAGSGAILIILGTIIHKKKKTKK